MTLLSNTGTLGHSKFGTLFASELWQFRLPHFTIFQNNGMSYIWATQDFNVDSNNVYKCECDQFKQLWHSRITCDAIDSNNIMYKTFKYSHGKEKYTEILP